MLCIRSFLQVWLVYFVEGSADVRVVRAMMKSCIVELYQKQMGDVHCPVSNPVNTQQEERKQGAEKGEMAKGGRQLGR